MTDEGASVEGGECKRGTVDAADDSDKGDKKVEARPFPLPLPSVELWGTSVKGSGKEEDEEESMPVHERVASVFTAVVKEQEGSGTDVSDEESDDERESVIIIIFVVAAVVVLSSVRLLEEES